MRIKANLFSEISKFSRVLTISTALLFGFSASASFAQTANGNIDLDSEVAFVGGEAILEGDLAFAAEDLAQELAQIPMAERKAFLVSVLIDMKVMAQAAKKANMDKSDSYKRRLKYLEDRALRRAYFTDVIGAKITPELVQKAYDEFVAEFTPVQEWRARHILVANEDDAKKIKLEIDAGKLFEVAAMESSSDTNSARNGGDLGYFRSNDMTPPFEEAAIALKIGQVSEPVKTSFGWHIIKLEDDRMSQAPSFEQVQGQIAQQLLIENFNEMISSLKKTSEIKVLDENIAAQILADDSKRN